SVSRRKNKSPRRDSSMSSPSDWLTITSATSSMRRNTPMAAMKLTSAPFTDQAWVRSSPQKPEKQHAKRPLAAELIPSTHQSRCEFLIATHIRQPLLTALEQKSQFRMVQAEQLQDSRVKVMDVNGFLYRAKTELVRCADGFAALDPAAGDPGREA